MRISFEVSLGGVLSDAWIMAETDVQQGVCEGAVRRILEGENREAIIKSFLMTCASVQLVPDQNIQTLFDHMELVGD
ncbi:MAG: hypothetical protein WAW37_05835 [Syntrophobacteraceae bacterium]